MSNMKQMNFKISEQDIRTKRKLSCHWELNQGQLALVKN